MPTIVIWNIAATCQDFHATATTPGVVMLSGWSPSLFKVLQDKGVVEMTPLEALRVQLYDKRYTPVREAVNDFFEIAKMADLVRSTPISGLQSAVHEAARGRPEMLRRF
jgi:hypothetical protein